jgi:hypothetical protein
MGRGDFKRENFAYSPRPFRARDIAGCSREFRAEAALHPRLRFAARLRRSKAAELGTSHYYFFFPNNPISC